MTVTCYIDYNYYVGQYFHYIYSTKLIVVLAGNLVFICAQEPYESILRKLSATLISMELEQEFLFKSSTKVRL